MSDVILFDLDGTLTDSGPGIIKCVQYALNYMGKPERDAEKLKCFVGPPLHEQFMRYAGFTSEEADLAVEQYRERYATIGIYENEVYERIPELLQLLRDSGKILGVASSKPEIFVEEVLCHFEIRKYFDVVVGSELDGRRSAKADVIEEALRKLECLTRRERVIMVGDREQDVIGAQKCGLQCIGAAYGYGGREELEKAGAVYIAETVEDLGILAQTDDGGEEEVSPHFSRRRRKKRTDTVPQRAAAGRRKKKEMPGPEQLGRMLWDIFYPMMAHFLCMMAVSFLGVLIAGMIWGGAGTDYMEVVERFPWLSSLFSALTAVSATALLWKFFLADEKKFGGSTRRFGWLSGVACAAAAIGVGAVWSKAITASGIREFFQRYAEISENTYENQNWMVLVICIGILASAGEELVFRGFIYRRAKNYFGTGWAVGISAALFGIYHGNMVQFLYAVVMGILFALLYEKTGTLLAPVIAHVAANIFTVSYDYIADFFVKRMSFGELLLIGITAVLAAAGIYYLFFRKSGDDTPDADDGK